ATTLDTQPRHRVKGYVSRGQGQGDLVLIYPKRGAFQEALPVFEFSEGLRLWVVPFDLDSHQSFLSKLGPR
ncbi:hypothetical protein A264_28354, partial [Pseudomonas syringae pv. actinidiae ICMP 19071]